MPQELLGQVGIRVGVLDRFTLHLLAVMTTMHVRIHQRGYNHQQLRTPPNRSKWPELTQADMSKSTFTKNLKPTMKTSKTRSDATVWIVNIQDWAHHNPGMLLPVNRYSRIKIKISRSKQSRTTTKVCSIILLPVQRRFRCCQSNNDETVGKNQRPIIFKIFCYGFRIL